MSGLLNSALNESNTNHPDTTVRSFGSSFSAQSASGTPGTVQGLHNIHGSFNIPNLPGSLASRNSTMNGVPSSAIQQPTGSISNGRFASNNIPVALSQISHGSTHVHSSATNRGMGVSPILGNAGPRIASSIGNIGGGGNIGRNLSSGGGLGMPGLASRLNLSASGSGSLSAQGPNRLMGGGLPQGPQVMSMLGNSYSGGHMSQNQVQSGNNSLNSMGMLNDLGSNESAPFDINDFPRLSGRPGSAGGHQGQMGSMRKQGVSSIVQQNQEFSIQNEDFPALPGFKGGGTDFSMDLHQKEQLHDNTVSMMQSQHFPMGRSTGFSLGGSYSSHHQQQHGPSVSGSGSSFGHANNQDLLHLHGSDLFPSSHASYHSQVQNGGPSSIGLRSGNNLNSVSGIGYDQLLQQYQQLNQSQFRFQQMSAVKQSFRDPNMKSLQGTQTAPDQFGLLGLLSVIRMSDPVLTSLALGIDLTTLGLNLNSGEDLHKKFVSPWSDGPTKGGPEYNVPDCYYAKQPPVLHQGYFSKFKQQTLFYIFYSMPRDEAQLYAANELSSRGWIFHKEMRIWLIRVPNMEPLVKTTTYERGTYLCFDPNIWDMVRKDNFVLQYELLEKRPVLPQH
ncbi:Ccr4-not transcription complex subunit [Thalictrum thalictroides]|uniref:Ccr4-not transcription complex subunit n=1 Tax=Thalictrum thalictroides TaxID=46969 RepID=A0A7J6WP46_THATH|nr:Ccr4-not transcription complex subunit [Thalictrum thalictroides]